MSSWPGHLREPEVESAKRVRTGSGKLGPPLKVEMPRKDAVRGRDGGRAGL